MLQRLPSHLNGRTLDRRQVQASYIFCVGLLLFRCREHLRFSDFVWPLLVACTISLCNHKYTVLGKPELNCRPCIYRQQLTTLVSRGLLVHVPTWLICFVSEVFGIPLNLCLECIFLSENEDKSNLFRCWKNATLCKRRWWRDVGLRGWGSAKRRIVHWKRRDQTKANVRIRRQTNVDVLFYREGFPH
jgi:hypothetical protein